MQLRSMPGADGKEADHAIDVSPKPHLDAREEVELPKLKEKLRQLNRDVQQAKKKVLETIDSKREEFVVAFGQIDTLRETVSQLQADIRRASLVVGDLGTSTVLGQDVQPAASRLRQAVQEHAALDTDLKAYEAVAVVLSSLLTAHRQLDDIAKLTSAARFADAAALCGETARGLEAISAPEASEEPAMLKRAKAIYYQRRLALVQRLEEAFNQLCAFGSCHATVRPRGAGATLKEVWTAFELLGLRQRRAEQLADHAQQALLRPLFESARRVPDGMQLQPQINTEAEGVEVWTWIEARCHDSVDESGWQEDDFFTEDAEPRKKLRPARVILPAIKSLLAFASEHWTGDSIDVCSTLGKKLWPGLVRHIMHHFQCSGEDGEALELFEESMHKKGFIAAKETTLSRHVRDQRLAHGELRRVQVLQEARNWFLQEEMVLTEVSEAQEKGSITQILKQIGVRTRRNQAQGGSSSSTLKVDDPIGEKLQKALKEDTSLLRLPSMHVSSSTHSLVKQIRSLMDEAVRYMEQGNIEAAKDLNRLVRELSALFAVLRPFAQQARIATSPRHCGAFFTDCLYLAHVFLVMPYSYSFKVPASQHNLIWFADLVRQLRRLGETHFASMLRHQHDFLTATFKRCDFSNRNFIGAETALMEVVQQVKGAVEGLSASLPAQLLKETAGLLIGMTCRELLAKLFLLQRVDPEAIGNISQLLTYALMMLRPVLASVGAADDSAECVPRWQATEVVADLLGSDFSRFLQHRAKLLQCLLADEVFRLLELSLREDDLTPQEAWAHLSS